jgi:hypothetical protein
MTWTPISAELEAIMQRAATSQINSMVPNTRNTYEQLVAIIERARSREATEKARRTKLPVNLDEFDLPPDATPPSIFDWDIPPDA